MASSDKVGIMVLGVILLAGSGCAPQPSATSDAPGEVHRLVTKAQADLAARSADLIARIDDLEERLHDGQARVRLWRELEARHARVAAISCESLTRHASSMAHYEAEQQAKSDALARKNRVALRVVPASESVR